MVATDASIAIPVASGILIAAAIVFGIRSAFTFHHRGETGTAIAVGFFACFAAAFTILAGIGY